MNNDNQNAGKRSAWMTHVKKTMRANKGKSLMQVLKMAKKTYKKTMRGGGVGATAFPLSGGRKGRKSRNTKKNGFKLF